MRAKFGLGRTGLVGVSALAVLGVAVGLIVGVLPAQATNVGGGGQGALPPDKAALALAEKPTGTNNQKTSVAKGRADAQAIDQAQAAAPMLQSSGIVQVRQGPFPASIFSGRNMFRTNLGGAWIYVFAGAEVDANGQNLGAVRVYRQADGGAYGFVGMFRAPAGSALTITSYTANTLTLHSDDGRALQFNFTQLKYV